jgi:hypothetical protein
MAHVWRDGGFFKFFKMKKGGEKGEKERLIYNLKRLICIGNLFSNSPRRSLDVS